MAEKQNQKQDRAERERLLFLVPEGASRIYVRTGEGKLKYRKKGELQESDVIQTTKKGEPIVMLSRPGHPNKLDPITPKVDQVIKKKKRSIEHDLILKQARDNPDSPDVLHGVLLGLGEEAASIKFEREQAERAGRETSSLSGRRIRALQAVGETWLKRRDQIVSKGVDLDSPAFQTVMSFLLETVREAMQSSGVQNEVLETVFSKLSEMLNDEWEAEARNRVKSVV